MLIGLIADVHSNSVALRAVLSVFNRERVEKILHAGDIIGYNPYPNETVELFISNKIISILGNHDRALITGDTSGFNPYADTDVLVLGHTHVQFMREYRQGIIVNPGSVGQPRDGNPDAAFGILDTDSGKVILKRTSYDVEKVIEDMLAAHLPEKLALRLRFGF